jgi:DNA-binding NarL/FixJ family response regulator
MVRWYDAAHPRCPVAGADPTEMTMPRTRSRAVHPRPSAARPLPPRPADAPAPARAQPPRGPVRVVVADHQAIDRGGMVRLLETQRDLEVVGESATIEETISQCRSLRPDVLIVTLNLPAQDREAAIPAIRTALPAARILALSERGAENCLVLNPPSRRWLTGVPLGTCPAGIDCLQLAAQQGAMATLRRSADPEDLFRAVRTVAEGQAWYDPTTAAGMLAGGGTVRNRLFTDRELQVAALIAEGQSNKEISTSLRISEPTVKKHVGKILDKLGLADRLQAGLYLARNPLLFGSRAEAKPAGSV